MKALRRILASALVLGVLASPTLVVATPSHQQTEKAAVSAAKSVEAVVAPKGEGVVAAQAAEGHAGGEAVHDGAAHKAGLPQLDPAYFPEQIFWLLISFSVLYLLMANVALPGVKATQEARRRAIKRDLAEAKAASEAAQAAQALSDKVMGEAYAKAVAAVAAIKSSASEESAERQAALQRELGRRFRQAEAKISMARSAALHEVHDKAAGIIAAEIMKKVVGGILVDPSHLTLPVAGGSEGRA
ncbi:MAG: ATPase [Bdellovibrionales bacterium]